MYGSQKNYSATPIFSPVPRVTDTYRELNTYYARLCSAACSLSKENVRV